MTDAYLRRRHFYEDISGSLVIAAATDDTTVVAAKASQTIYVQRVHFVVTTLSATTGSAWNLQDDNGTPRVLTDAISTVFTGAFDRDYGPEGLPATEGKGLVVNIAATGAVGLIQWEGYRRLTATVAA